MSGDHRETWRRWLTEVSPWRKQMPSETIENMAEALALSAPTGPAGFPCQELQCEQHSGAGFHAARLYSEIADKLERPVAIFEKDLADLTHAINLDLLRPRAVRFPRYELSWIDVIVSRRNAEAASARAEWDRTWAVIAQWMK